MNSVTREATSKAKCSLALLAVVATFIGLIPTIYATYLSNSLTLFSDFLRCFVEFLAVFFAWLTIKKISSTDISRYNYGFGKLERVASLAVALAMLLSFLVLSILAYYRFLHPVVVEGSDFGHLVSTVAVLANGLLWLHYWKHARRTPSPVIDSQAKLFRAKTFASVVVVLSLALAKISGEGSLADYSDPLGSACVALFLLYSSYTIASSSVKDLIDCSIEEVYQLDILKILVKHESRYKGFKRIRSRRSGTSLHIEVFLEFDRDRTMSVVQESVDIIAQELSNTIPDSDVVVVASAAA